VELIRKVGGSLFFIATGALMFLLPFNGKLFYFFDKDENHTLLPLCIIVMLCSGFFTDKFTLKMLWSNWAFKGFTILFLAYAFSAVFVTHSDSSLQELTRKLSLIVVPFMMLSNRSFFIKHKQLLFTIYFTGVLVTIFFLDIQGLIFFNDQGFFPFYIKYSLFTHPTYIGSNILISIVYIFGKFVKGKGSWLKKTLQMLLLLVLVIHLVFLLSKAVLISAFVVLMFFFFYLLFKDVKKMILYLVVFGIPLLFVFLKPESLPKMKDPVTARFSRMESYNKESGSTAFRYKITKHTLDIIGKNWLYGVGVGDEQNYLMNFYEENGWEFAHKNALNAHNQFVQTCLSIGLFGVLVLLALFLVPLFINEFGGNKGMLVCFLFIFCTEAMLERQAGIVLFVFFYMFSFALQGYKGIEEESSEEI